MFFPRFSLTAAAVFGIAAPLMAGEPGGLSSLQSGPIGACPLFFEPRGLETEARVSTERSNGRMEAGADAQIRSTKQVTATELAALVPLGPDVRFAVTSRMETRRYEAEERSGPLHREDATVDRFDLSAGPAIWFGRLGLGGAVGVESFGDEEISVETLDGEAGHVVEAAVVPMVRGFAGWRSSGIVAAFQVETYDGAVASVRTHDTYGQEYQEQWNRRPPETYNAHARMAVHQNLSLGLGVRYTGDTRGTNDSVVAPGHWSLTAGGIYQTPVGVGLVSSFRQVDPAYDETHPPSLFYENLGGSRLAVGLVILGPVLSLQMDIGYSSTGSVEYRAAQAGGVGTQVYRGKTSVEEKTWDVAAGVAVRL